MELSRQYPEEFRRVVERAWQDDQFKALLLRDPVAAVAEEGIAVPEAIRACGVRFQVVEDTQEGRHIVLPAKRSEELSALERAVVAGGKGGGGKRINGDGTLG